MASQFQSVRDALDHLRGMKSAYQQTYSTSQPAHLMVLDDMARFCRANESCAVPGDHDRTMLLLGRNEVWLRVNQYLHLNPEQLFALYGGDISKLRSEK